ncbi:MAG: hypothetical protein WC071_14410, partial [Victivallaceae bacterium]
MKKKSDLNRESELMNIKNTIQFGVLVIFAAVFCTGCGLIDEIKKDNKKSYESAKAKEKETKEKESSMPSGLASELNDSETKYMKEYY